MDFLTPLGFLGAYSGARGKSYLSGWMFGQVLKCLRWTQHLCKSVAGLTNGVNLASGCLLVFLQKIDSGIILATPVLMKAAVAATVFGLQKSERCPPVWHTTVKEIFYKTNFLESGKKFVSQKIDS